MMKVRAYIRLDNPRLKAAWEDLYSRNSYCFQSSYAWCSLWWKNFRKSRRRPFVVVCEENNRIVGIAPFMIERKLFFSELKFIGSGLTDFHEILTFPGHEKEVMRRILDYVLGKRYYDLVNLEQVSDRSSLHEVIQGFPAFKTREMIKCPVINIDFSSWEAYLHKLSRKMRWEWSKKYRDLGQMGNLQSLRLEEARDKAVFLDRIYALHMRRWGRKHGVSKFVRGAMRAFLSDIVMAAPEVIIYVLLYDDRLISYHLGFSQKDVFYAWNSSYDPAFGEYSVGNLLKGLVLKDLIERNFQKYNDMRGNYDWKRRWMPDEETITNSQYLAGLSFGAGALAEAYYLRLKWQLKGIFHNVLGQPLVQKALIRMRY